MSLALRTQSPSARLFSDKIFILLIIFACAYIMGNIGTGSLTNWDEAVYANVSREIVRTGNWFKLQHGGSLWLDKPPLYIWFTSVFYRIFGVNEFSTRLTSSLFGVATIALLYVFIKEAVSSRAALIGSLTLLGLPHYLHFAKMGMLDVTLTFFLSLMIYSFWKGEENANFLFVSGLCLGFAYLTKGAASFLGPGIIFIYSILTGKARLLFRQQFLSGIVISLVIIAAWYGTQYHYQGSERLQSYFGSHIFGRAMQARDGHEGGFNFYQKAIFNKNKPWSPFLYLSVLYLLWLAKSKRKEAALVLCWTVGTYLAFSSLGTKLHWYIIPIYPALAFSFALSIDKFAKNGAFRVLFAIVVIGLIVQIPVSWAFKLNFSDNVKQTRLYAMALQKNGKDIRLFRINDENEAFYLDNLKLVGASQRSGAEGIIYIVNRRDAADFKRSYGANIRIIREYGDLKFLEGGVRQIAD